MLCEGGGEDIYLIIGALVLLVVSPCCNGPTSAALQLKRITRCRTEGLIKVEWSLRWSTKVWDHNGRMHCWPYTTNSLRATQWVQDCKLLRRQKSGFTQCGCP